MRDKSQNVGSTFAYNYLDLKRFCSCLCQDIQNQQQKDSRQEPALQSW